MMKNFKKPFCEVVRFNSAVIATSACGCWDGVYDDGAGNDCTLDGTPVCTCEVNHIAGTANCTPCSSYN